MDKNQKNQIKTWVNSYLSHWKKAEKELEEIKMLASSQEQYKKVESTYREHSNNLDNANKYYSQLGGDTSGTNWIDESKYRNIVNSLKEIKDKYEEKNNKSSASNANTLNFNNCSECKRTIVGQYFQKDGKKFCSQYCLDEYYVCDNCKQKVKEITGNYYQNDSFLQKRGTKGLICEICYRGACSECYQPNPENYYYHKEKADNNKFCSKDCFINHYEKELIREKETKNHEEALEELKKLSKERKDMVDDFNKGLNDYIEDKKDNNSDIDNNKNKDNSNIEREREREQNQSQQSQLLTEISNLEQKPTKSPQQEQELTSKKKELEALQKKEKELFTALPLENKITILEKEIKELEKKENKNKAEEQSLAEKKQELERLLAQKNSSVDKNNSEPKNKTFLYLGLGIIILLTFLMIIILTKNRKSNKKKLKK